MLGKWGENDLLKTQPSSSRNDRQMSCIEVRSQFFFFFNWGKIDKSTKSIRDVYNAYQVLNIQHILV